MILVVDLDHSFLKIDLLHEALAELLLKKPFVFVVALTLLIMNKARGKAYLAKHHSPTIDEKIINQDLLAWIQQNHPKYKATYLVSASPQEWVNKAAAPFHFFNGVYGSTELQNLKGKEKLNFIVENLHPEFSYVGDSVADLPIWEKAKEAIVIGSLARKSQVERTGTPVRAFFSRKTDFKDHIRLLRPHQWAKNALIFLPLLLAYKLNIADFLVGLMAFFSFSLAASSVYIINDIVDLDSDRKHKSKWKRPLASGAVSPLFAILCCPILLGSSYFLAGYCHLNFTLVLTAYLTVTTLYSFFLKRQVIIDVITLALLYTIRIYAGGLATETPITHWLLIFSVFFFLSLALVKRFVELNEKRIEIGSRPSHKLDISLSGRGYQLQDIPMITNMGIGAGLVSILIFVLYMSESDVVVRYQEPHLLWGVVLILIFWLLRVWLLAGRGLMNDDPVVFAIKDRLSLITGFIAAIFLLAAFIGIPA